MGVVGARGLAMALRVRPVQVPPRAQLVGRRDFSPDFGARISTRFSTWASVWRPFREFRDRFVERNEIVEAASVSAKSACSAVRGRRSARLWQRLRERSQRSAEMRSGTGVACGPLIVSATRPPVAHFARAAESLLWRPAPKRAGRRSPAPSRTACLGALSAVSRRAGAPRRTAHEIASIHQPTVG